ncbi:hypothetical protein LOK49_LG10G02743 [Camellia lanceoleosa]|uniref:Uncharacterized protein n=1 Tax=Camellia lanceoleosa TaxID=1840588 RepID=A0ACC0G8W6_9ERIC|nr:hypothetical protein LOK49_LG10G02743 [Camellia lanceoleosa]
MENHPRNEITSNKGKEFGEEPNPEGEQKQNTAKESEEQNRSLKQNKHTRHNKEGSKLCKHEPYTADSIITH